MGLSLNANQREALADFAYNLGGGVLRSMLGRAGGNLSRVPGLLGEYNHASGRVDAGLTARRAWEGQLFMTPAARWGGLQAGAGGAAHTDTHIGQIVIHTQATDAKGIGRDIRAELGRFGFVAQANTGLS